MILLPLARVKNFMNRSARVLSTQPVSISLRSSALLIRSLDSFDLVDDYNTDIHSLPPLQLFKGVALSCNPHEKRQQTHLQTRQSHQIPQYPIATTKIISLTGIVITIGCWISPLIFSVGYSLLVS